MKQVVYIDVLFVINMFINYLVLLITARLIHTDLSRGRLLGGAALGGVYALLIFTPVINVIYSIGAKLLFSLSIVLSSFKNLNLKGILKALACFYGVTFAFAGAMFAVWIAFKPNGMMMNNGIVYFNISVFTLIITSVTVYFLLGVISKFSKKNSPANHLYRLSIYIDECVIQTAALMDTGNGLSDTFSETPVIVIEYNFIQKFLPNELKSFFQGNESRMIYQPDNPWRPRLRLIPFSSMGGEGLLPAFRPDKIIIRTADCTYETSKVIVAVCKNRLMSGEYFALLNPALINEREKVTVTK